MKKAILALVLLGMCSGVSEGAVYTQIFDFDGTIHISQNNSIPVGSSFTGKFTFIFDDTSIPVYEEHLPDHDVSIYDVQSSTLNLIANNEVLNFGGTNVSIVSGNQKVLYFFQFFGGGAPLHKDWFLDDAFLSFVSLDNYQFQDAKLRKIDLLFFKTEGFDTIIFDDFMDLDIAGKIENISSSPVPEPMTLSLFGIGLLGLIRRK